MIPYHAPGSSANLFSVGMNFVKYGNSAATFRTVVTPITKTFPTYQDPSWGPDTLIIDSCNTDNSPGRRDQKVGRDAPLHPSFARSCRRAFDPHYPELLTNTDTLFYYLLFRDHLVDVCPCGLEDFKKYFLGGRTTTSERDRATPEACRSRNSRCLRARGRCRVEQICHMGGFASWSGFMYLDDITLVSRQGLPTHRLCTMARNPSSSYVLFHASTDTQ